MGACLLSFKIKLKCVLWNHGVLSCSGGYYYSEPPVQVLELSLELIVVLGEKVADPIDMGLDQIKD